MTNSSSASCDIAVIGGGPGGSTTAALLAQKGYRVMLFEKDRHPRFHIGESLLPLNLELFDKLGVAEKMASIGMIKRSAEFYIENDSAVQQVYSFADAFDKRYPYAYQVRRSEFDEILLRNAQAKGADVHEGWRVTDVAFEPVAVKLAVTDAEGRPVQVSARYLVDATGRETFLAGKLGLKHRNPRHTSAALYSHFRGARRGVGESEGNIAIHWFPHGWFWFIPLLDGVTSVGAVCWPYYLKTRRTDPTTFLKQTIELCPSLADRLRNAEMVAPATATGNYSYICDRMTGDRYIMVGDAFAFVDPVFSSGVLLAMSGAFKAAEVVDGVLKDPSAAPALNRAFDRRVRQGVRRFSWMIYRITKPAMRYLMLNPGDGLGIKRAVISLLAGDVFRDGPVWWRLICFRIIYYSISLRNLRDTILEWRRHRRAIAPQAIQATDGSG
jgi:flavin-dependent dehydrogenase